MEIEELRKKVNTLKIAFLKFEHDNDSNLTKQQYRVLDTAIDYLEGMDTAMQIVFKKDVK